MCFSFYKIFSVVMARLLKLHAKVSAFESFIKWNRRQSSLIKVMSLPYNAYGYNLTDPPKIDCYRGCDPKQIGPADACIMDKFSTDIYSGRNVGSDTCLEDYAVLIRHRVEELFPVEQLKKLCTNREFRKPTGNFRNLSHSQNNFTVIK